MQYTHAWKFIKKLVLVVDTGKPWVKTMITTSENPILWELDESATSDSELLAWEHL